MPVAYFKVFARRNWGKTRRPQSTQQFQRDSNQVPSQAKQ